MEMKNQKLLISNRGNLGGRDKEKENKPDTIRAVIDVGFCVKTDIWLIKNKTVTGVDQPIMEFNLDTVDKEKILIQARNPSAFAFLLKGGYHCFWRESDNFVMTNRNFVLSYAGTLFPHAILMMPEDNTIMTNDNYIGICSDFIAGYSE